MIARSIEALVRDRLGSYPAVALLGARQTGKTTLARSIGGRYFDLEIPGDVTRLDADWDQIVSGDERVILDEAHSWPELFPRLRGAIDADRRRMGRFLILGSISPSLMIHVSESLRGRLALVELSSFVAGELQSYSLDDLWLRGGLPDGSILRPDAFPEWQRNYLALLAERDLPSWGLPAKPAATRRLLAMLAADNGQTWNASRVATSMGLDRKTIGSYVDYLEGAFLLRRMPPFQANIRKRITRAPKVLWRDTGLLHATLDVRDLDQLYRQPWVGASWETFVTNQILDTAAARGLNLRGSHLRTSDKYELDLVLEAGRTVWAIEIKLTSSPAPQSLARLRKVADMAGADRAFLICRVEQDAPGAMASALSLPAFLRELEAHAA